MARSIDHDSSGESSLIRVVTESGALHGINELEKKGIERIRVLNPSRLQELIRVALNRALRSSLTDIDISAEARDAIRRRAQEEYKRLLREGLEVSPPPEPTPPPAAPSPDPKVQEFLAREHEALRKLIQEKDPEPVQVDISPISDEFRSFENRMVQSIGALLEKDWRQELHEVKNSHREQLEVLEQRIASLVQALETTDRVLSRIQRAPLTSDPGIPAGEVGEVGPLSEKKSQLLKALLQANLELRQLQGE